ncbi:MAG: DoxX family protein [Omnitrophica WOR_2 bacterium]
MTNTLLWVAQGVLAGLFLVLGLLKLLRSKRQLVLALGWAKDFPEGAIKAIGVIEVLAALCLVIPAVTGVLTWLVPLAAAVLVLDSILFIIVHLQHGEYTSLVFTIVFLLVAAYTAYGRFVVIPKP